MTHYNPKDRYFHQAKKEGYVARSAYKLIEIDQKFGIFKKSHYIIDLGCSPGSWLQVAHQSNPHLILTGVDLLPLKIPSHPHLHFIQGDFLDPAIQQQLIEINNKKADWVLSDMAPNTSGIKFKDATSSIELCTQALDFARRVVRPNGGLLCKIFPGAEFDNFRRKVSQHFKNTTLFYPKAIRDSSRETYLVASGLNPLI